MTHFPYLDWLYEDARDLSAAQADELRSHLAECAECRMRAGALRQVEGVLHAKTMAGPAAGFVQRWQARHIEERLLVHRRQTRVALVISLSALVTVLGTLSLLAWPYLGTLETAFWAFAYQSLSILYMLAGVGEFMTSLLRAFASAVPLLGWLLAVGMVFELGVLWVVSYRLLTNPRRIESI